MAAPTIAAPRVDTAVSPDVEFLFLANAGADLTAIAGKPNHAPQKCLFINPTAGALNIIFTAEKGVQRTLSLPANCAVEYNMPVALVNSGSAALVEVIAFWWAKSGCQFNRGTPA